MPNFGAQFLGPHRSLPCFAGHDRRLQLDGAIAKAARVVGFHPGKRVLQVVARARNDRCRSLLFAGSLPKRVL